MKKQLSKKDIKEINQQIEEKYPNAEVISLKGNVTQEDTLIKINNEVLWFFHENKLTPTLKNIAKKNFLPTVIVDMGAVKFMVKGADVFRPGITKVDESVKEKDIVAIVDETHHKPLALGIALLDAPKMQEKSEGKVITTIHYVGDEVWNA